MKEEKRPSMNEEDVGSTNLFEGSEFDSSRQVDQGELLVNIV